MLTADHLFQRLLKDLRPVLAGHGFRRSSQNFVIESAECWGVINFQKSLYSSPGEKRFTINVAIAGKRILRFYGEPEDKPPLHYKCHWEVRLGELISKQHDRWWTLSDEESYLPVLRDIQELIVSKAVSIVKEHMSEDGLLTLWEKILGGFEYPILKHKSIVLAEQGKIDELPAVFQRIREICVGGPASQGAQQHISTVRVLYGLHLQ